MAHHNPQAAGSGTQAGWDGQPRLGEFLATQASVPNADGRQSLQAGAVGAPRLCTAGGDAPVVVEVYALGSGVAVEREGGNLPGRQGAFELEAHGKRLVVDPLGARKAHWNGATVQGDVRAVLLSLETVDQEDEAELGTGGAHGYLPQKTAILSLPQGSGKSAMAQDLARRLGCTLIVEEWSAALPLVQGALHLTNTEVAA